MPGFDRCGSRIFRVKFTAAEQKAIDEAIGQQLREQAAKHEKEEFASFAWELHTQLGFGEQRIERFLSEFVPILRYLTEHYEVGMSDATWLCSQKLKDAGIDFDRIYDNMKG